MENQGRLNKNGLSTVLLRSQQGRLRRGLVIKSEGFSLFLVGPAVSTFPHFRNSSCFSGRSQKENAKILSAAMCAVMRMT